MKKIMSRYNDWGWRYFFVDVYEYLVLCQYIFVKVMRSVHCSPILDVIVWRYICFMSI